ncbi:MAG: hypothetical protein WC423_17860 [Vulcanimicrobiota bacterium]
MNIKLPGDKTEAACETCQRFAEATWQYGPFRLKDGTNVTEVMQAYCDTCGESLLGPVDIWHSEPNAGHFSPPGVEFSVE